MPVLSYRADRALAQRIKEAARRDDRCVSAFTRRLVREALETRPPQTQLSPAEPKQAGAK